MPHCYQKWEAEKYLQEREVPYISLRAGAFLDRGDDIIPDKLKAGQFPDILPDVPMALIYSKDLARYASQAALAPEIEVNQYIDIGIDVPATGAMVAQAFSEVLGRPIVATAVFSSWTFAILPYITWFLPQHKDNVKVLAWLKGGGYVSDDMTKQARLFGHLPTVKETVAAYCQDKNLH